MTVIDIHTHMLSQRYLQLLVERSAGTYTLGEVPGAAQALHKSGAPFLTLTPGMFDYELRIAEMDRAGVDVSVISLTCPNVYFGDEQTSDAAARLVNDEMAAAARRYPGRVRFLASLPWQYPERAIGELKRAVDQGAVGVMVLANIDGASLTDPRFAQVWSAIDARELPVLVHPTTPPGVEVLDMARYHLTWSVGFTFDTTLALSRMILDGFFDRYTRLKIIGAHAGGYLPFVLPRLDQGFDSFDSVRESISVKPSEYAHRLFVDSIVYSPASLAFTVAAFGADRVLYGSDYPHKCGRMQQMVQLADTLPEAQARQVKGGNAERIFRL